MNICFLMDPLERVIFEKDTSFVLMLAAEQRGHRVFYVAADGLNLDRGQVIVDAQAVIPQADQTCPFLLKERVVLTADQIDAVMIRTDPPFDDQYLTHTWLLDLLPERCVVVNAPSGIRTVNEKLWAAQFTDLVPATLVTRNRQRMRAFLDQEQEVIVKPTNGYGGQGIFRVRADDPNRNVIFETVSRNFRRDIILQAFVPAADEGDKRILLLNGAPLGAVLRRHAADDHRNNFFSGGKPYAATITAREEEIIARLRPELVRLGLYFVGIDILGDYLIEVNVTSPTCLQEMNRLYDQRLEDQVMAFVEQLCADRTKLT